MSLLVLIKLLKLMCSTSTAGGSPQIGDLRATPGLRILAKLIIFDHFGGPGVVDWGHLDQNDHF